MLALPARPRTELDREMRPPLIKNGVSCVAEGANMPSTVKPGDASSTATSLYAPGKTNSNVTAGVATPPEHGNDQEFHVQCRWQREEG